MSDSSNKNNNNSNSKPESKVKLNEVKPSASDKRSFRRNDSADFSKMTKS